MKKICLILSLLLLLNCFGCQSQTSSGTKARTPDSYLAEAEHYIEAGDTETAIRILEEGIEKTGDEKLTAKLAELQPAETSAKCPSCDAELKEGAKFCPECSADTATQSLTVCPDCNTELKEGAKFCPDCGKDLTAAEEPAEETEEPTKEQEPDTSMSMEDMTYCDGTWTTTGANYENGGLCLDVTLNTNNVVFDITLTGAAPSCRLAMFTKTIAASELKNPLSFDFEDDGWGNSGTVTLNFFSNSIGMEVSNVKPAPDPWWGFTGNETYTLYFNPYAHEDMAEPEPQVHTLEEALEIIYADIDYQIRNATISWSDADQLYYFTLSNNTGFTYYLDMNLTFYNNGTTAGYDQMYGTVENGYYYNILLNCSSWTNFEATYTASNIYENGVYIG